MPSGNTEKKRGGKDQEIHGDPDRNGDGQGMNMTERESNERGRVRRDEGRPERK